MELKVEREVLRCHEWKGTHIPGCWGCVIYGHTRCYCEPRNKPDELQQLRARVDQLERQLKDKEAAS